MNKTHYLLQKSLMTVTSQKPSRLSTKYHATKIGIEVEEEGQHQDTGTCGALREHHHPLSSQAQYPTHQSKLSPSRLEEFFPIDLEKAQETQD